MANNCVDELDLFDCLDLEKDPRSTIDKRVV